MNNTTQSRIKDIQQNGFQLDFNTVFTHAFENYKKIALYAGLILFIFFFIFFFFSIIIIALILTHYMGIENINEHDLRNLETLIYSDSYFLWSLIIASAISIFLNPFFTGFYKMTENADKDIEFNVSNMFVFLKNPHLKEIVFATIILSLLQIIVQYSTKILNIQYVGTLLSYLISFLSILTFILIALGNLKALEAIKGSFIIVSKQPLTILALVITTIFAVLIGFFGCCIGVLFTIPFIYSIHYAIYINAIGYNKHPEINDINNS